MKANLLIASLLATPCLLLAQLKVGDKAPSFVLKDQFEKTITYKWDSVKNYVLVFSDREGREKSKRWNDKIRIDFKEDIIMLHIAVIDVPFFVKPFVLPYFKNEPSIPIDWGAANARKFGFIADEDCTIVVISETGKINFIGNGDSTPVKYEELKIALSVMR